MEDDPLYETAEAIAKAHKRVSISLLQLHMRIGYIRAARLIERMEKAGLVYVVADPRGGHWKLTHNAGNNGREASR